MESNEREKIDKADSLALMLVKDFATAGFPRPDVQTQVALAYQYADAMIGIRRGKEGAPGRCARQVARASDEQLAEMNAAAEIIHRAERNLGANPPRISEETMRKTIGDYRDQLGQAPLNPDVDFSYFEFIRALGWLDGYKQGADDKASAIVGAYHGAATGEILVAGPGEPLDLSQMAADLGGKLEEVQGPLPDGSGFAVMCIPLPRDHWIYQRDETPAGSFNVPPMPLRTGCHDSNRKHWEEWLTAAGRYAIRCATENGKITDFDPDALVQNLIVGMLGYNTPTALNDDDWVNPPQFRKTEPGKEADL